MGDSLSDGIIVTALAAAVVAPVALPGAGNGVVVERLVPSHNPFDAFFNHVMADPKRLAAMPAAPPPSRRPWPARLP